MQRLPALLATAFGIIFLLVAWDLVSDWSGGVDSAHVAVESLVLGISGIAMMALLRDVFRQRRSLKRLTQNLDQAREESTRWRDRYQETISGLGQAIQEQFHRWNLSAAEAEIGLMLLKGLSLKEIARIRGTGERTVREQARAVYQKAGLANRAALSAFFLEDLLLPDESRPGQLPSVDRDNRGSG
jgi:DNA-binding NarL/FixJ family response regulator